MATETSLRELIEKIFSISGLTFEPAQRDSITALVQSTVNGDHIVDSLAIFANIRTDAIGALVYVLTDRRMIKFEFDATDTNSVSFPLDTFASIERSLEGNRKRIQVTFQKGGFGLTFTAPNEEIDRFFQNLDQARNARSISGIT